MRKLLLFGFFALFSSLSYGQTDIVKINPFGLLFGNINAGWEHVIGESSSVEVGLGYRRREGTVGSESDVKFTGFSVYGQYRKYFGKKVIPNGFYVAPGISYSKTSADVDGDDAGFSALAFGAIVGHQWAWNSGFVLDLGLGINYYNLSTTGDVSGIDLDGIGPAARVALGFVIK